MRSRTLLALTAGLLFGLSTSAADNVVEIGSMKSKAPESWKEEQPTSAMRLTQFKVPKAEGDAEDAELIVFYFKQGSGSAEDNLKRQLAKFEPGKDEKELKVKT